MKINELIRTIKTPITENDMISVCDLTDEQLLQYTEKYNTPDKDGLQRIADYIERDRCNLYITTKGMCPLVYWDGAVFMEIHTYDDLYITEFKTKERIDQQYKTIDYAINEDNSNLNSLMYLCNGNARYLVFKYIYAHIPDDKKYEFFKHLYTSSEYGFKMFTDEFIEDVMSHKPANDIKKLAQEIRMIDEGYVTVYRGMCSESTPAEHSWSWTTDLQTAIFFATRFDVGGKIATGKACLEDIIDFINDRNEFEVFINPKDVKKIEEVKMMEFNDMKDELEEKGIIDRYHNYCAYIDADSYFNPKGCHGVLHVKRVLLLSLILSSYELDAESADIVAWAAVLHDIGRDHDGEDEEHGIQSWEKAIEDGLVPEHLDEEQCETLRYVIEQHCKPDDEIYDNIKQYKITSQVYAWKMLKVFKDCDGLDRVRLGDLDTKYLRTKTAPMMILLASQFLKGIK